MAAKVRQTLPSVIFIRRDDNDGDSYLCADTSINALVEGDEPTIVGRYEWKTEAAYVTTVIEA
jgi:hypothetical protein